MTSTNARTSFICGLVLVVGTASSATSKPREASKKGAESVVELTQTGKTLAGTYAGLLRSLKVAIKKQFPAMDDSKVATWMAAIKAEEGSAKEAASKVGVVAKMKAAESNLRKLEENQQYAPKTLSAAKDELRRAKARGENDPEKEKELASAERFTRLNRDVGASPHVAWNNANDGVAVFGGTSGTVSPGAAITVGGLTFDAAGYVISGGVLSVGVWATWYC